MPADRDTHLALTWRTRFLLEAETWPENGSSFRMLRAAMRLADEAGADGRLHGKHDWWTERHLAERMHVTRKTARKIFRQLEQTGWLETVHQPVTREGMRQPDMRRLRIPQGQRAISALPLAPGVAVGPTRGKPAAQPGVAEGPTRGNAPIEPLPQSVDTEIRSNGEDGPDVTNVTNGSATTNPITAAQKRLHVAKKRVLARQGEAPQ